MEKDTLLTPKEFAEQIRESFKLTESDIRKYKKILIGLEPIETEDRGEVIAQLTIGLRDLESSRMRFGKVIQYYDGGISVYDKK